MFIKKYNITKPTFYLLLTLFLSLAITGCSSSQETKEKQSDKEVSSSQQTTVESYSQTLDINKIVDLASFKIRIINVSLVTNNDPSEDAPLGKIALGVEIGNTSEKEVIFYPEDIEMTLNTGEVNTPDLTLTSSLGGSYPPRRVQQGFITFPVKESELGSINKLTLKIPFPESEEKESGNKTEEIVISL